MRTYETNPEGEFRYILHCINGLCRSEPDSVTTIIWLKEYKFDLKCEKCGDTLIETMDNWIPMPKIKHTYPHYNCFTPNL